MYIFTFVIATPCQNTRYASDTITPGRTSRCLNGGASGASGRRRCDSMRSFCQVCLAEATNPSQPERTKTPAMRGMLEARSARFPSIGVFEAEGRRL